MAVSNLIVACQKWRRRPEYLFFLVAKVLIRVSARTEPWSPCESLNHRITTAPSRHDCGCRYSGKLNPLEWKGVIIVLHYMKLVHSPVTGGLLHLVEQRVGWPARPGPSSLYQTWQPTHQQPVYQSPYCCIMVPLLCGFNVPIKGLR